MYFLSADVSLIALPCNLAHCYFDEMNEASAGIPLLHIADSALEALPAEAGKVAILATEPTHEAGFYQQRIRDSGREVIDSQELRSTTTSLIGLVKAKGFRDPEVQARWHNLMSMVGSTQADAVLIACSRNSFNFAIVDTATSLSRATIRHYRRLIEEKNDSGAAR
ncbi:aspartate/glutamate racemase family protein [Klebsiella electrica]|uniref:Aspartate/glutamate racemase family protein n=1 Tax=Klebsiella electrica TaxID=1259973 RepID=A0AAJ5UGJ9_9ENTR|nr:aspartate/glutamate racemase family protein [Klebsiella electrica]WBW62992.1 aspartate/glutamate racemase family protein [Klebsiella electrica]